MLVINESSLVCTAPAEREQRSELDQQRIGHVGQQNFSGRGSARGGRDADRNFGVGSDIVSQRDQQYHAPSMSNRGRQPRQLHCC